MPKPILLSVVLTTYDGEAYLGEALESLASQWATDMELVIVDDGSTDRTREIIASYRDRLSPRILYREHRGNWVENAGIGLARARGTYASLLHQDDRWAPDRMAALRPLIARFPDVDLFFHAVELIDGQGGVVGELRAPVRPRAPLGGDELLEPLLTQNFISAGAAVFRRRRVFETGGLDPALPYAADWDLWLKLARRGTSLHEPRRLSSFRLHGRSQTVVHFSSSSRLRSQLEPVVARHASGSSPRLRRLARCGLELNVWMASLFRGQPSRPPLGPWARLGPVDWVRFARYARIQERALSRMRAGLLTFARDEA